MVKIYGYTHGEGKNYLIIKSFIDSCDGKLVDNRLIHHNVDPEGILVFRTRAGWSSDILKECWKTGQHFLFIDTGYFLHRPKIYHRITWDHYQKNTITPRPDDRWKIMQSKGASIKPWQKTGEKVLVTIPSEKSVNSYNFSLDEWTEKTYNKLKENTDREIIVRGKPSLLERKEGNTIDKIFASGEIHAVVTFQSGSSIEALFAGIPVFVDEHSAAAPVGLTDLTKIDTPIYPDLTEWVKSLSYAQFTVEEMRDGTAWKILKEERGL